MDYDGLQDLRRFIRLKQCGWSTVIQRPLSSIFCRTNYNESRSWRKIASKDLNTSQNNSTSMAHVIQTAQEADEVYSTGWLKSLEV